VNENPIKSKGQADTAAAYIEYLSERMSDDYISDKELDDTFNRMIAVSHDLAAFYASHDWVADAGLEDEGYGTPVAPYSPPYLVVDNVVILDSDDLTEWRRNNFSIVKSDIAA